MQSTGLSTPQSVHRPGGVAGYYSAGVAPGFQQTSHVVWEKTTITTNQSEAEYNEARHKAQQSHEKLQREQAILSSEQALNSALKAQIGTNRDVFPYSAIRVGPFVIDNMNNEQSVLEARLQELARQIAIEREQYGQATEAMSQREFALEQVEAKNFLQKNEMLELQHLGRMVNIFEQENSLLTRLYEANRLPSNQDFDMIRLNIVQVRAEIDSILAVRASLNAKFDEMATEILRLRAENKVLQENQTRPEDLAHIQGLSQQILSRNTTITQLSAQIETLKAKHEGQPTSNDDSQSGWDTVRLKRELSEKVRRLTEVETSLSSATQREQLMMQNNRLLSEQIFQLKKELGGKDRAPESRDSAELKHRIATLETKNSELARELNNTRTALQELGRITPRRDADSSEIKQLEQENLRLRQTVESLSAGKSANLMTASTRKMQNDKQDISFRIDSDSQRMTDIHVKDFGETADMSQIGTRTVPTVKKDFGNKMAGDDIDDILLSEEGIMGVVSLEEMAKLEHRVKEFGECNIELEDLIYRLKSKMTGTEITHSRRVTTIEENEAVDLSQRNHHSSEHKSAEILEIKQIVTELKQKMELIQTASVQVGHKSHGSDTNFMGLVELLMQQTKRHEAAEVRCHTATKNLQFCQEELATLKDHHRDLQTKYNTITVLSLQQENQIESLLAQLQDQKNQLMHVFSEQDQMRQRTQEIFTQLTAQLDQRNIISQQSA